LPAFPLQRSALLSRAGVKVERLMTDNGSSVGSHRYAKALRGLKMAERFV
jgi:hypothetical protein